LIATPCRVVPDTNVLVSSLLRPNSEPARAVAQAVQHDQIIASVETLAELSEVLRRPKFARYLNLAEIEFQLDRFTAVFEVVEVIDVVADCWDPKDNKFLELAVSGRADIILSGDNHLLTMHPWRGVDILTASQYLALERQNDLP